MPALRIATCILVVGTVAACTAVSRLAFTEPTVELREIQIAGIGFSGGTLNLVLDVYNPNHYAIRGVDLATSVAIDGTPFGDAELARALDIPAEDTSEVEVPLRFTWEGVGAGARALLQSGSVPYTLDGTVRVQSPIGEHAVQLSNSGRVSLRDLVR